MIIAYLQYVASVALMAHFVGLLRKQFMAMETFCYFISSLKVKEGGWIKSILLMQAED